MCFMGSNEDLKPVSSFRAAIFVQDYKVDEITTGFTPIIFVGGSKAPCRLIDILWKKGPSSHGVKEDNPSSISAGDEAEVIFAPRTPFIVSPNHSKLKRLVICNGTILSMLGRVLEVTPE